MTAAYQVWLKYPAVFLVGVSVTMLFTAFWRRYAPALGFLDVPDGRRIHNRPIVTAGGIAVFCGFHAACALVFLCPWLPFAGQITREWWARFAVVSACVVATGMLDDRLRLRPAVKLAGQVAAAVLAYWLGMRMGKAFGIDLPMALDIAGTVIWFLVFINAFNLIDGMDGLAAGLGVVAAVGVGVSLMFRHQPGDVLLLLALAGAGVGFLRYNFHPASVFLGDTGSMFIGCTLAALALGTSSKGTAMASIGVPILAAGVPVLDTGLAVWRRSVRAFLREDGGGGLSSLGLATADAEHLHHRLIRRGLSQPRVAIALYVFGGILSAVGVVSAVSHESSLGLLLVAFLVGAYVVIRHLAWIELWDSGSAVLHGLRRPIWTHRALLAYPVIDVVALSGSLLAAIALLTASGKASAGIKHFWFDVAPYSVGLPFVLLVVCRAYSRVWSLARVSEYTLAGGAVTAGILMSLGVRLMIGGRSPRYEIVETMLHLGLAVPLVVGARAFVRIVQDAMAWMSRLGANRADARRVLLVGAGPECTLFLKERSILAEEAGRIVVVGVIDEDPSLCGRWVHGYRVLGGINVLPRVLGGGGVDQVVVVGSLSPQAIARVVSAGAEEGVVVRQWTTSLKTLTP